MIPCLTCDTQGWVWIEGNREICPRCDGFGWDVVPPPSTEAPSQDNGFERSS